MKDPLRSCSAAPPSRSSPSSDCFPILRLPLELVQLIIESSAPLQYHSSTYISRQSTLCRLCLVSKLFYEIARPLLFSVVSVRSDVYAWGVLEAGGGPLDLVQELVLHQWRPLSGLEWDRYAGLRLLVIECKFGAVRFASLACLPNLTILRLREAALWFFNSFALLQLQELELHSLYLIEDHILNPASLPSLRMLACHGIPHKHLPMIITALNSLAPQLDLLSLDFQVAGFLEPDLLKFLDPSTLWDINIATADGDTVPPVSYLRIDYHTSVEQVIDWLERVSIPRPALLYRCVEDVSIEQYLNDKAKLAIAGKKLGIEIVYEDQGIDWCLNGSFSTHFRKRMERKRMENGMEK